MNTFQVKSPLLTESDVLKKTIAWLRFPMAIMVVFIHYKTQLIASPSSFGDYAYNALVFALSDRIPEIAVPLFFFFSGYLYFRNVERWGLSVYWDKTKKRLRSLLVPYILWNFLFLFISVAALSLRSLMGACSWNTLFDYLKDSFPHFLWDMSVWDGGLSFFGQVPDMDCTGPIDLPLWFVRNLMLFCLLTPVWHWLITKLKGWFMLPLLFAYIGRIWPSWPPFGIGGVFWFCFGAYLGINKKNLVTWFEDIRFPFGLGWLLLVSVCLFLQLSGKEALLSVASSFCVLIGVGFVIRQTAKMIRKGRIDPLPALSSAAFFVFAAHKVRIQEDIFAVVNKLTGFVITDTTAHSVVTYLLWTPFAVAVLLVLFALLKHLCPKVLGVMVGGRI